MIRRLLLLFLVAGCARGQGARAAVAPASKGPVQHVILVTIDGMKPETYLDPDAHGLRVPTLRAMLGQGAAGAAQSVFPTVTYPSHTSIATGMNPGHHGIVSNWAWDPAYKNQEGWRWYSEDIHARTLWQAAGDARVPTVLVDWPVTMGAHADVVIPEYWRAGTPEDAKLARVLASPGVFDETAKEFPGFWDRYTPPNVQDAAGADLAVHLIETRRPGLLLLHIWQVDDAQHDHGVWSPEAVAALENADAQLGRLVEAAKRAGIWDATVLVVASDHGFAPISQKLRIGLLLAQAGLVQVGPDGAVTSWKATVIPGGGQAYIYLADDKDAATAQAVTALFKGLEGKDGSGIGHVFDRDEIRAIGGDAAAFLAVDAADQWSFSGGFKGDLVVAAPGQGTHGWDPREPAMQASLLFYGPPLGHAPLTGARLIDVAPTIARWLGLDLPNTDGKALDLPLHM